MLEKPDLPDETIIACLQNEYGLPISEFAFLPLGADQYTAVYRAITADGIPYFVKLRRGIFDEIVVELPKVLNDQGIRQIIPILATKAGQLRADLGDYKLILYPFIDGHNGYQGQLSDGNWVEFGHALKSIHAAVIPSTRLKRIPTETFSPQWRDSVKCFMERVATEVWHEPVAEKTAALLKAKRAEILDLVSRTERLVQKLLPPSSGWVVCHSDIHAGNILIDFRDALYIVDWDNPIIAPKERDLMFVGGGQFANKRTPQEEEILFYQGYGQTEIDQNALAYYRYERIITDIAVYCDQLLSTDEGGEDREQAYHYLASNFLPNGTIEIAYKADKSR